MTFLIPRTFTVPEIRHNSRSLISLTRIRESKAEGGVAPEVAEVPESPAEESLASANVLFKSYKQQRAVPGPCFETCQDVYILYFNSFLKKSSIN